MFKREWFEIVATAPASETLQKVVRYWDKAATAGGGDYSCGVLMGKSATGLYYVLDVVHGQWSADNRNRVMMQTAITDRDAHGDKLAIWCEQEPGSGGKESAEQTIKMLAGWNVRTERVTGDKPTRAMPFSSQGEGGNVRLVQAAWNRPYVEELALFPNGAHDDMVDGSSGAFNKIEGAPAPVDLSAWIDNGAF